MDIYFMDIENIQILTYVLGITPYGQIIWRDLIVILDQVTSDLLFYSKEAVLLMNGTGVANLQYQIECMT